MRQIVNESDPIHRAIITAGLGSDLSASDLLWLGIVPRCDDEVTIRGGPKMSDLMPERFAKHRAICRGEWNATEVLSGGSE